MSATPQVQVGVKPGALMVEAPTQKIDRRVLQVCFKCVSTQGLARTQATARR